MLSLRARLQLYRSSPGQAQISPVSQRRGGQVLYRCATAPVRDWQTSESEWKLHPFSECVYVWQQNASLKLPNLNCHLANSLYFVIWQSFVFDHVFPPINPLTTDPTKLSAFYPPPYYLLTYYSICLFILQYLSSALLSSPLLQFIQILNWVHPKRPCGCIIHSLNSLQNRLIMSWSTVTKEKRIR